MLFQMKNPLLNWFVTRLLRLQYGLHGDDATIMAAAAAAAYLLDMAHLSRTLVRLGYVCHCNSFHVKCINFSVGRRLVDADASDTHKPIRILIIFSKRSMSRIHKTFCILRMLPFRTQYVDRGALLCRH